MERFKELQAKAKELGGYLALSKEEKAEYQSLKPKEAPVAAPKEDDRIARLEAMVEKLSGENTNLREETAKQQEGWGEYTPPSDENKTATVKIYRKDADSPAGVVIKAVTLKNNAFDEETRKYDKLIFKATVRYDDGETEDMEIDGMEFAKMQEIEQVEIIKEDTRKLRKVAGYVPSPDTDKQGFPKRMLSGGSGYGSSIGSGKVPLEVFRVESTVTVKRSNGQEFEIESDYLNL
jgi:hypothetical protein